MKNMLKRMINKVRDFKNFIIIFREWDKFSTNISSNNKSFQAEKILIFPSDLKTITGALGDDAMISASVQQYTQLYPKLKVDVLCRSAAIDIARKKGYQAVVLPWISLKQFPQFISALLSKNHYKAIVILGADIMDGYYGFEHPAMALIAADIAVKYGINATILGASFNNHPKSELASFFNKIDSRVHLNMRDKTSFERLTVFSNIRANLVADAAFMLKPGQVPSVLYQWIKKQREENRIILGINVHPMLIKNASESDVVKLIGSSVQALNLAILMQNNLSYLLIPHDYRGDDGDARCLKPIFDQIKINNSINSFYLEGEHAAADLKAIAGLLDGVITGRMHLAIASLGMGVPVLSLTYQDKFEGLYRHFDLPKSLLLSIEYFDDPKNLADKFIGFVNELDSLKQKIKDKKPEVIELSKKNFIA